MERQFVLDASVTIAWCFEDEASAYADAVLDSLLHARALAPAVWPLEISNVLAGAERRGRIDKAGSIRFVGLLMELPIIVEVETPRRVLLYLDLAMREGIPLATQGRRLQQAAEQTGVTLYLR